MIRSESKKGLKIVEGVDPCPFNHISDLEPMLVMVMSGSGWLVRCDYCMARGPWAETRELAVEWWNKRTV